MKPIICSKCKKVINPADGYAYYPITKKTYCDKCDKSAK